MIRRDDCVNICSPFTIPLDEQMFTQGASGSSLFGQLLKHEKYLRESELNRPPRSSRIRAPVDGMQT